MMKPSASFDNVDVREIGLKSLLKSVINVDTLGTGGTLAQVGHFPFSIHVAL